MIVPKIIQMSHGSVPGTLLELSWNIAGKLRGSHGQVTGKFLASDGEVTGELQGILGKFPVNSWAIPGASLSNFLDLSWILLRIC